MRKEYVRQYKSGRQLRASLDLLRFFVLEKAWATAPATFAFIFIRLADRCLYHATNVWHQFEADLNVPIDVFQNLSADAVLHTGDLTSKYEIEAYLGAAKTLFEPNLIGISKQNHLGRCFASDQSMVQRLTALFAAENTAFRTVANNIRNHSYHANPELRDAGFYALVKNQNQSLVITLPNIYEDKKGHPVDLVDVFIGTHVSIERLLQRIRDTLLEFFIAQHGAPGNSTYLPIQTPFGNMMVGLGLNGFEFRDYENP